MQDFAGTSQHNGSIKMKRGIECMKKSAFGSVDVTIDS